MLPRTLSASYNIKDGLAYQHLLKIRDLVRIASTSTMLMTVMDDGGFDDDYDYDDDDYYD